MKTISRLLLIFLATALLTISPCTAQAGAEMTPIAYRQPTTTLPSGTNTLQSGISALRQADSENYQKQYGKALLHYSQATKVFSGSGEASLIYKARFGTAQACYFLGYYDKARPLLQSSAAYYAQKDPDTYLNSLYYQALTMRKKDESTTSSLFTFFVRSECKRLKRNEMEPYLTQLEGLINFDARKYDKARQQLEAARQVFSESGDFANAMLCHYYIGMSYWMLKDKQGAITHFKSMDILSKRHDYLHPEFRPAYEKLIAVSEGDDEEQLYYIQRLQTADAYFRSQYSNLYQQSAQHYNAATLQSMERDLNKSRFPIWLGIGLFALLLLFIFLRYSKWQKHFIVVTDFSNLFGGSDFTNHKLNNENINPDIESTILERLDKFEQERQFLEREMTLAKMAALFNTNTRYVAFVIVKHRGKGTVEYLNDLKIDLLVQLIKNDEKYRQYTQDALAEEAGFSSRQKFTIAFRERMGISAVEFIKQLQS